MFLGRVGVEKLCNISVAKVKLHKLDLILTACKSDICQSACCLLGTLIPGGSGGILLVTVRFIRYTFLAKG